MSDEHLIIPETMRPIVDVRQIAADLSYAHWLVLVSQGAISEAEEAKYTQPSADDFTVEAARELVEDTLLWFFNDQEEGLEPLANFDTTRTLMGKAATLGANLDGLDVATTKKLVSEFSRHETACRKQYEETRDQRLKSEERLALNAARILRDLIIPNNQGAKEVLFSGQIQPGGFIRLLEH